MSKFDLKRPCKNCPFRRAPFFFLTPERVEEIAETNAFFYCHNTIDYSREDDNEEQDDETFVPSGDESVCAGFLMVHKNQGTANQMMRISERLGMLDLRKFKNTSGVYDSFEEYQEQCEERG